MSVVVEWLQLTFELSVNQAKVVASVVLVVGLILVRFIAARILARGIEDTDVRYRSLKTLSYVVATIALLSLGGLWFGALRNAATILGVASAGLAIALSDVLMNFVGWIYITLRRPFHVDDRIEIDGVIGDIIDIRVFRTTVLEIGNWVDADQSTGRIVHIPNGKVFTHHVYNATEGFAYLWHELSFHVTFESDWRRAEQLFQQALDEAGGHTREDAARRIQQAAKTYKIRFTHLTPTVYISVRDRGVMLTGRILVDTRRRRSVDQQVWRALLDGIAAEPTVEIAYPTTRTHLRDPLRFEGEAAP
ncbi:MAG: mechanosensitive ion channel family protein [Nitriliruptor sp.]|nr:MAG: mechanosensitive ion channel family protein [Nitriliruptor sp.]